jgi:HSP20 family protein
MAVTPWEPFTPLIPLRQDLERLFSEGFAPSWRAPTRFMRMIPVDITETDDAYVITTSLPGSKPEAFQVTASGNGVTIHASKAESAEEKKAEYIRRERYEGANTRLVELPTDMAADKVPATYEAGMLTLQAPKAETATARTINIKVKG